MAFEGLFNKPMLERELLDQLVAEIQSNYFKFQDECFFLKLSKVEGKKVQIVWEKSFPNAFDLADFYYDTKHQRACIMVKFEHNQYHILCQGFFWTDRFEVLLDRVVNSRPFEWDEDKESKLMVSRELIEKGFGEISETLVLTKRKKAV